MGMFDDLIPSSGTNAATADLPTGPSPVTASNTLFRDTSTATDDSAATDSPTPAASAAVAPGMFDDLVPGDRARLTFYTRFDDPGYADGRTAAANPATGQAKAQEGVTVAVDPDQIPYGSQVRIPSLAPFSQKGDGVFTAHDTGADVVNRRASGGKLPILDVYVDGQDKATAQARRDAVANSIGSGGMAYQVLSPSGGGDATGGGASTATPAAAPGMFDDLIPGKAAGASSPATSGTFANPFDVRAAAQGNGSDLQSVDDVPPTARNVTPGNPFASPSDQPSWRPDAFRQRPFARWAGGIAASHPAKPGDDGARSRTGPGRNRHLRRTPTGDEHRAGCTDDDRTYAAGDPSRARSPHHPTDGGGTLRGLRPARD